MKIIEYTEKHLESLRDLLVELEEFIVSIDEDNLDQVGSNYREQMVLVALEEINQNGGKCFLAIDEDEKVIGAIIGTLRQYEDRDYLDYKCPKEGIINELIVTQNTRSSGVGSALISSCEEYFKKEGCLYSLVDVFAYNKNGIDFYTNKEYHSRMYTMIKKIK